VVSAATWYYVQGGDWRSGGAAERRGWFGHRVVGGQRVGEVREDGHSEAGAGVPAAAMNEGDLGTQWASTSTRSGRGEAAGSGVRDPCAAARRGGAAAARYVGSLGYEGLRGAARGCEGLRELRWAARVRGALDAHPACLVLALSRAIDAPPCPMCDVCCSASTQAYLTGLGRVLAGRAAYIWRAAR
jgi:hypothetical protein